MSQYSLYHNHVHFTVPCKSLPEEDPAAVQLLKNIVTEHLHRIWKPEDKYVLMSDRGDHFIYDNGHTYRMADSG